MVFFYLWVGYGRTLGLDILYDGSRVMRLSVQGCLILLLCFFSAEVFAEWSEIGSRRYSSSQSELAGWEAYWVDDWIINQKDRYEFTKYEFFGDSECTGNRVCRLFKWYRWVGEEPPPPPQCVALSHEPDPITGTVGSTNMDECSCDVGYKPGGGVPGEEPFDCVIDRNQQPEECYENGQIFDPKYGYCVLDCPEGQLNGTCLNPPADNADQCTESSPDFKGTIGHGSGKLNVCDTPSQCGDGGTLGFVNDSLVCIADSFAPPECSGKEVLTVTEFGSYCNPLNNTPEEPETPEEPNTDTDGDGVPDEYQRENDADAVNKGLDDLSSGVSESNKQLKNANNLLENIGKGISQVNKNLTDGLGTANNTLNDLNDGVQGIQDGLKSPEGGYGLGELLNIPTISETATEFQSTILGTSLGGFMIGLSNVPQSTSCPTYTFPATDYWAATPVTFHCDIIENYRSIFSALFMFFWTSSALFAFYKA